MDAELLNSELVRDDLLKQIIYFEESGSTNEFAKKNKTGPDTLIIASSQTNGTGRFNRHWHSSPGKDLTFTITKNLNLPVDEIHLINFYSSYILFHTLKFFFIGSPDLSFSLKWPNDILLNGKKISGLLLEIINLKNEIKNFIIGIGINVNPDHFPDELGSKATSLKIESGREIIREKLLIEFIRNFYLQLSLVHKKEILMKEWISNTDIIGKKIDFRMMNDDVMRSATVISIDFDGALKLKFTDGGIKKHYSGEISLKQDRNLYPDP
ncbi:MAG: biotin--[acetyl-CoA-carboxylase] ligase [Ignavibacteria bacterium]